MPQFSYDHPVAFNGQIAEYGHDSIRSYLNAFLAQITTVLWDDAPSTAGDYTVRIVGEEIDETITYTSPGAETNDQLAQGTTAEAALLDSLLNVVTVGDPTADTNTLPFLHENRVYTVTATVAGAGSVTVTNTQTAGGTRIPLGTVVVQGATDREAQQPSGATVAADAVGIVIKSTDSQVNFGDPTLETELRPGTMMATLRKGSCWVFTEDAVVANAPVFFRIASPTLSTEAIGRVRSDADGGDAVQLFGARFLTSASAGELVKVEVNMPANA